MLRFLGTTRADRVLPFGGRGCRKVRLMCGSNLLGADTCVGMDGAVIRVRVSAICGQRFGNSRTAISVIPSEQGPSARAIPERLQISKTGCHLPAAGAVKLA